MPSSWAVPDALSACDYRIWIITQTGFGLQNRLSLTILFQFGGQHLPLAEQLADLPHQRLVLVDQRLAAIGAGVERGIGHAALEVLDGAFGVADAALELRDARFEGLPCLVFLALLCHVPLLRGVVAAHVGFGGRSRRALPTTVGRR